MDTKDFEGLTKFKIFVPLVYCFSWFSMLMGPMIYPGFYEVFCTFFVMFITFKVFIYFLIMIYITYKSTKVFKRIRQLPNQQTQKDSFDTTQEVLYGFIIPNYMQEVEVMAQTLDILAAHTRSKSQYLIFLAMQAHQQGCQAKATELMKRYSQKFRIIDYTLHKIRNHQQKGKASNVSWCAEHLQPIFDSNNIDPDNVMLTILDADSWAPNIFFDLVDEHIAKNFEKRHTFIFQPPQIFTRNNLNVPIVTRVYDIMHAFSHCSNLYSAFGITFSLSNYTLSYKLVKSIGFWDTCADAIGEDFHTCQKAYWKTNGNMWAVPIYAPFNQLNISTGMGYCSDINARFWQAQRHAQGVSDLAYQLKMLLNNKFRFRNLIIVYQILENFILPGILPWVFLSLMLQPHFLYGNGADMNNQTSILLIDISFKIMTVTSGIGFILFQVMKRRANKLLYHQQNQSILRLLEYPLLFMVNLFLMSTPSFVIAAFGSLKNNRQYTVASKKI